MKGNNLKVWDNFFQIENKTYIVQHMRLIQNITE